MASANSEEGSESKNGFFDNLILGMGGILERHPSWLALILLIIVSIPFLLAFFDGLSSIWLQINPPPLKDPAAPIYKYAAKIVIDVFGGFLISSALIILVGYIKIRKLTETIEGQKIKIKEDFDSYIKDSKALLSDSLESTKLEINGIRNKTADDISNIISDFSSTLSVLVVDEKIRDEIGELSNAISKSIKDKPIERRIITRGLLEGLVKRFNEVLTNLPTKGSVMEPDERRNLTEELFDATKSYVVIANGLFPLRSGPFRWHDEYLDFVKDSAAKMDKKHVAWVFITDKPAAEARSDPAVKEAIELEVPCFIVPNFSSQVGASLNPNAKAIPKRMGPLIEVFSGTFAEALHSKSQIAVDANLTWKATSFAKRGTKHSGDVKPLEVSEAIASMTEGSVWFDDEIAKVIRASQDGADTSSMSKFLAYVCEARVAAVT